MNELEILNNMLDKYDFNDEERGLLENLCRMFEDELREFENEVEEDYQGAENSEEE